MSPDRQLWGLGGLSAAATLLVLLGASGSGANISRAAAAVFGAQSAAAVRTTGDSSDARNADSAATGSSDDAATGGEADADAAAGDPAFTAADDADDDTAAEDDATGSATPATTPADTRIASNIKHVFVVTLAGKGIDATFGAGSTAPYLSGELRPKGVLLSGFTSLGTSGLADRLAFIGGQPPNAATKAECPVYSQIPPLTTPDKDGVIAADGCLYPNTVVTLGEQIQGKRLTWKAYAEDYEKGPKGSSVLCRRPDPDKPDDTQEPRPGDTFAARNVPWAYYRGSIDVANCDSGVVPLTKLQTDLKTTSTTPNFTYIAPGLCSDGSRGSCSEGAPGGLAAADAFLRTVVPPILASPAFQTDGLLIVTFAGGPGAAGTPSRNGTLLISRFVQAGGTVDTTYDPYSLLRTIEDLWVVSKYLANAATATGFADDVLAGARPPQPGDD